MAPSLVIALSGRGRALRIPQPRRELSHAIGGMFTDALEHVGEPGERILALQPAGTEQSVKRRGPFAAGLAAAKRPVIPSDSNRSQARSAALLSIGMAPSSTKRVSSVHCPST